MSHDHILAGGAKNLLPDNYFADRAKNLVKDQFLAKKAKFWSHDENFFEKAKIKNPHGQGLRNMDPPKLCNGTRLVVTRLKTYLIG